MLRPPPPGGTVERQRSWRKGGAAQHESGVRRDSAASLLHVVVEGVRPAATEPHGEGAPAEAGLTQGPASLCNALVSPPPLGPVLGPQ